MITSPQINAFARLLAQKVAEAFKDEKVREEYEQWEKAQQIKEENK